jgi:hypothetical protein
MSPQCEAWTAPSQTKRPGAVKALQAIKELAAGYLALSVLTLATIVARRHDAHAVNSAVWTHGIIVTASAFLTLVFVIRAARGSRRAYLRLRIVSIVMPLAILGIIALPGTFPLWMKIEQAVCGVMLVAIAVLANNPRLRSAFRKG